MNFAECDSFTDELMYSSDMKSLCIVVSELRGTHLPAVGGGYIPLLTWGVAELGAEPGPLVLFRKFKILLICRILKEMKPMNLFTKQK